MVETYATGKDGAATAEVEALPLIDCLCSLKLLLGECLDPPHLAKRFPVRAKPEQLARGVLNPPTSEAVPFATPICF
jgi:hypothetical protein